MLQYKAFQSTITTLLDQTMVIREDLNDFTYILDVLIFFWNKSEDVHKEYAIITISYSHSLLQCDQNGFGNMSVKIEET